MPDARDLLTQFLTQIGLQSESAWALDQLIQGRSAEAVQIELEQRTAFQTRFPHYSQWQQEGRAKSVAEILAYEDQWRSVMRSAGFGPGTFLDDPAYIQDRMDADIAIPEIQQRVQSEMAKVTSQPPEVRAAFADYFGADGDQALAMVFLDDTKALPELEKMANAAVFGGTGTQFGFGVDLATATRAGEAGIGAAQARQGFDQLATQRGYLNETITENTDITAQQGVAAQFGLDPEAQRKLQQRKDRRAADFAGAGVGALATNAGITGLGSAEGGKR